jgi:hypothetical protein
MGKHDDHVARWGVRLPQPTPKLLADAADYAKRTQEAAWKYLGSSYTHSIYGEEWVESTTNGQVAAELVANYYGTSADWTIHPERDPGWDTAAALPSRIDSKQRQAFLTIRPDEYNRRADYYALVQHRTEGADYIYCGVIKPVDFRAQKFDMVIRKNGRDCLLWTVTAEALIPPAHFHPFEM